MQRTGDIESTQGQRRLKRLFWSICFVGWFALVTVTASFLSVVTTLPFRFAFQLALGFWGFYALATPLVLWLARRFPLSISSWRRNIGVHLVGMLAFVLICEGGFLGMILLFEPKAAEEMNERHKQRIGVPAPPQNPGPGNFDNGLPDPSVRLMIFKAQFGIPFYWVLVGVAHSVAAMIALREREKQSAQLAAHLSQAQLAGLRTQLQPHFLFNTLNSIAALIPQNQKQAAEMVLNLSDLLRMTLRDPQRGEICLSEELQLLRHYVDIQRLRFGEKLDFRVDVSDDALNAFVPPLLLQPLVENAIRHGLEASEQTECIVVQGGVVNENLHLEVANTFGGGLIKGLSPTSSTGVGLTNTRARLNVLYGDKHRFEAGPNGIGGFKVTLEIPAQTEPSLIAESTHENPSHPGG